MGKNSTSRYKLKINLCRVGNYYKFLFSPAILVVAHPTNTKPTSIKGTNEKIEYEVKPQSSFYLSRFGNKKGMQFLVDNNVSGVYTVDWGFYDKDFGLSFSPPDNFSALDRGRALATAKSMWKKDVFPKIPEGSVLMNKPIPDDDGKNTRAAIYKRFGFGELKNGYQYAIVRNGKLEPVNDLRIY